MADTVKYITPILTARYPKLDKQDVYDGKEVGYKLSLIDNGSQGREWAKLEAAVADAVKRLVPAGKKPKGTPIKTLDDGTAVFNAKTYKKPVVVDAKNRPIGEGVVVGGGSELRANITFDYKNNYVTAYFGAVQVRKLVAGVAGGFDELPDDDDADTGTSTDDDIPF